MEQKWLDGNERLSKSGIFHYLELCMEGWHLNLPFSEVYAQL